MARINLVWRGGPANDRYHATWYGTKTVNHMQMHSEITLTPDGIYRWGLWYAGFSVAQGEETKGSGGLKAAKESVSIAATDYIGHETY